MAVDKITETHDGGADLAFNQREFTRTFLIHCNASTDREDVVEAAISSTYGVALGVGHPVTSSAWCRAIRPNRRGPRERGMWQVECFYSNGPLSQAQEEKILQTDPTARKAIVELVASREQVPCVKDRDGNSYNNSAGDPFDPPLTKMQSRPQLRVRKNYATMPTYFRTLADSINDANVSVGHGINYTFPEKVLLFVPEGVTETTNDNGISFVEVRFTLDIAVSNDIGWDREILDAGYYYKPDGGGGVDQTLRERVRFMDQNAMPSSIPQLLNGDGDQSTDGPHYLTFGDYPMTSFAALSSILA